LRIRIGAARRRAPGLAPNRLARQTDAVMRMMLEAFWPSRRITHFDEFCRPAA